MYKFIWNLSEESWFNFLSEDWPTEIFLGTVRCGDLCWDIMAVNKKLYADLYVGGVDTGYGYSREAETCGYPYDMCQEYSFDYKGSTDVGLCQFKNDIERHILEFLNSELAPVYTTHNGQIVNLVHKAVSEVKEW